MTLKCNTIHTVLPRKSIENYRVPEHNDVIRTQGDKSYDWYCVKQDDYLSGIRYKENKSRYESI